MKKKFIIVILLIGMMPSVVLAHPGRTDSNGCHYCRTNCTKYGLSNGQYHCHNGGSSSGSSNSGTTITKTKSNDATLKYIIIDNNKFDSVDNVKYSTTNENVNIEVVTNDSNARYEVKNNSNLSIGENTITIDVTAEDGTSKNYNINVTREKILSNDTQIKIITIDSEEFDTIENIQYTTTKEIVFVKVVTNDENAKYEIKKNSNLSIGDNSVIIEVTAEDGTTKEYNINVIREKIPSSDTGITVTIDDEVVSFDNYKSKIYIASSTESIDFDYTLSDENAKVEIDELNKLKTGDNAINIKVIAEDGTKQQYEIILHKCTKSEETITTIFSFGIIGGMGYGIYYCVKKGKQIIKKIMKK